MRDKGQRPDPRSGVREDGSWEPVFGGQRPPLEPGHDLTIRHGAYATVHLAPRAEELAAGIRDDLERDGLYSPSFERAIARLAIVWSRIERAQAAIDRVDETVTSPLAEYSPEVEERVGMARLREDLRGWLRLADRIEASLGLTPDARVKLGVSLELVAAAKTRRAQLVERYRDDAELGAG